VPLGGAGPVYAAVALLAGACSCWRRTGCWPGPRRGRALAPMRLFHMSITYLTLLFVAVAVDPFVL
jgi:protoheme IX farnesyltransferase